jgi:hypothetical protein
MREDPDRDDQVEDWRGVRCPDHGQVVSLAEPVEGASEAEILEMEERGRIW